MTFQLILFVHVASMLGLFVATTIEWVSILSMRRARTFEEARHGDLHRFVMPIGVPSTLGVLASGVWLARTLGLWDLLWVKTAVPALVLVAIAGAVVGPRRKRTRAAIANGEGTLAPAITEALRHRLFIGSLSTRTALLLALVFVMTVKP